MKIEIRGRGLSLFSHLLQFYSYSQSSSTLKTSGLIVIMETFNNLFLLLKAAENLRRTGEYTESERTCSHIITELTEATYNDTRSDCQNIKEFLSAAFNERGLAKYFQVDFHGAIEDFDRTLQLNTTLAAAHYNRGLIFYRLAFYEKAIEDMDAALAIDPNFVSALECKAQSMADLAKKLESVDPKQECTQHTNIETV